MNDINFDRKKVRHRKIDEIGYSKDFCFIIEENTGCFFHLFDSYAPALTWWKLNILKIHFKKILLSPSYFVHLTLVKINLFQFP